MMLASLVTRFIQLVATLRQTPVTEYLWRGRLGKPCKGYNNFIWRAYRPFGCRFESPPDGGPKRNTERGKLPEIGMAESQDWWGKTAMQEENLIQGPNQNGWYNTPNDGSPYLWEGGLDDRVQWFIPPWSSRWLARATISRMRTPWGKGLQVQRRVSVRTKY